MLCWEDKNENDFFFVDVSGQRPEWTRWCPQKRVHSSYYRLQPGSALYFLTLIKHLEALDTLQPFYWTPNHSKVYVITWLGSFFFFYINVYIFFQLTLTFDSWLCHHHIATFCISQSSVCHSWTAAHRMWALNLLSCPSLTRRPRAI